MEKTQLERSSTFSQAQRLTRSTPDFIADKRPSAQAPLMRQKLLDGRASTKPSQNGPAQLAAIEEEPLQVKSAESGSVQLAAEEGPRRNETGLPDSLKAGIESMSGMSMDNVQVHSNSPQPAQLNALAYAQGTDIHVAPGQEQHLPHEAWHVVQQAQGRVQPTMQMAGVGVNDDGGLEREADVMGAKAAQFVPESVPVLGHFEDAAQRREKTSQTGPSHKRPDVVQGR